MREDRILGKSQNFLLPPAKGERGVKNPEAPAGCQGAGVALGDHLAHTVGTALSD